LSQLFRILCAVDFSEPAQAAFEQALALSRARDAELTVVHAVPKDEPFQWNARKRIATIEALRQAAAEAGIRFKVSVQHGNPAGVILLHALARRPHLIVIGTHQRRGLERLRTGSVAETVTLRAACPVLAVPAPAEGSVASPTRSFESILCAVDFSAVSSTALRHTLSLATASKGRVTLVHVVPGISRANVYHSVSPCRLPEYVDLMTHDAWRRLQDAVPPGERKSGRVHVRVVTGDPSTEIARIAADVNADVIVMGVTSRNAVGRRLFGATATRVMRTAGCAVLAVPALGRGGVGFPTEKSALDAAA
jgi:nucleotide-binding universal stress UspA family protein